MFKWRLKPNIPKSIATFVASFQGTLYIVYISKRNLRGRLLNLNVGNCKLKALDQIIPYFFLKETSISNIFNPMSYKDMLFLWEYLY